MRGVSLDEIADTTKIGTRLLRALEEEQFDLLPGGIFNKGFVRAYARHLGMDEEQAVADYLQAAGAQEPDFQRIVEQSQSAEQSYAEANGSARRGFPWIPMVLLLVVVAAGFGGWQLYQQYVAEHERTQSTQPGSSSPAANTASSPSSTAGKSAAPSAGAVQAPSVTQTGDGPARAAAPQPKTNSAVSNSLQPDAGPTFEVVVGTTNRAWVSIKADGKYTVRGIITSDEPRKVVRARDEVVVTTGNAGATEVSFQGKPVAVEGGVNEPKVMIFNPRGLRPAPPPKPKPVTEAPPSQTTQPSPAPQ